MRVSLHRVGTFLKDEDGPTSVEYSFMIGFILLVCIAAIDAIGDTTNSLFQRTETEIVE